MANDANVVSQQRTIGKNVTGNQNGFPSGIAQFSNEVPHLCNHDWIQTVNWFIQNQKDRVVHNSKDDCKPLFHAKNVLRKQLLILKLIQRFVHGLDLPECQQSSGKKCYNSFRTFL